MAFDNPKQKQTIIIIVVLLFIAILVVSWILGGKDGLTSFFKYLFFIMLFAIIIFIVIWLAYTIFFKKNQIDVTFKNKQALIRSGKISKPVFMKELHCKGDKTHQSVKIGKIVGYCRIENYAGGKVETDKEGTITTKTDSQTKRQEDVFVVETSGFPMNLFADPVVIRVEPKDWEGLSKVYLDGINLVEVGQYYYLHKDMLQLDKIDVTIKSEALRYVMLDSYSDYMQLIKKAEGLDTEFNKEMDKKKLMKLPIPQQQQ